MASRNEMKVFLAFAQYHAFTHARCAGLDQNQALSLASQALQQLARQHAHALPTELPLFFFRILQTAIRRHRRSSRWHQWLPSLAAALIPPRTENTELGPLETITVAPQAATESLETWSARSEITYVAHAALCILPPLQREAFLLIAWQHMDFKTAATVMACSKRRVHLHVNRAHKTLAAIFAQKGLASAESSRDSTLLPISTYFEAILSHEHHDSDAQIFKQLAQACAAALSEHQRQLAIPSARSERWTSFRIHHTLLLRRIGIGVFAMGVLVLALYGNTLRPAADTSADDIQVLASTVPLDTLLKANFKELLHD